MKVKIGKHEHEERDSAMANFAGFYLEQDRKKSNVYFAAASGESVDPSATLYYKILPGNVVYKKSRFKLAASLAVFLMTAFSFSALFYFFPKKAFVAADNSAAIRTGFDEILSAQKALAEFKINRSFFDFNSAHQNFQSIKAGNSNLSALALSVAEYLPFASSLNGGKERVKLESDVADAGMAIAKSIESVLKIARTSILKKDHQDDNSQSLGEALPVALDEMKSAQDVLKNVLAKLENSGENEFLEIAPQFRDISDRFSKMIFNAEFIGWVLGADHQRNFVIVVQNTAQARATAGAITSVGLVTAENGYVTKVSFDDVYNIDGQLQTKVIPPGPIQKLDTAWSLHNANWFLDFPTSAKKIAYFYQQSQSVSPDGVIAVNEKTLDKFLELTGPIDLLKYDLTIDKDNFKYLTAFNMADEKRANQAKRVFNDTAALIFEKLVSLPEDKVTDLLRISRENAINKDILVWLNEEKYERVVSGARWGGEVPTASDADYLSVVATDLNETASMPLAQNIQKQTEITDRGEVINTIVVERKRQNDELSSEKAKKPDLEYMRAYVPYGSELVSASGIYNESKVGQPADYAKGEFKTDQDVVFSERASRVDAQSGARIFQESGKTVFGAWLDASSGAPAEVTFKYKLPFLAKSQDHLNFMFQKQPGAESRLNFKVLQSDNPAPIFSYDDDFSSDLFFDVPIR